MRDNFKSISDSIRNELLSGYYNNIMIYATEKTINRIQDKFKTEILILMADDESTKIKKRERKKKYYIIRIQNKAKITV